MSAPRLTALRELAAEAELERRDFLYEAAEQLREVVLRAEPIDDPDALWVDDLVGARVELVGSGDVVGQCVAVMANPASDLLELDSGALVPVVFIVERGEGRIVIDPPEGLFDL